MSVFVRFFFLFQVIGAATLKNAFSVMIFNLSTLRYFGIFASGLNKSLKRNNSIIEIHFDRTTFRIFKTSFRVHSYKQET